MAYRKSRGSGKRSYGGKRRTGKRAYSARRTSGVRRGSAQTVRLVVQMAGNTHTPAMVGPNGGLAGPMARPGPKKFF